MINWDSVNFNSFNFSRWVLLDCFKQDNFCPKAMMMSSHLSIFPFYPRPLPNSQSPHLLFDCEGRFVWNRAAVYMIGFNTWCELPQSILCFIYKLLKSHYCCNWHLLLSVHSRIFIIYYRPRSLYFFNQLKTC